MGKSKKAEMKFIKEIYKVGKVHLALTQWGLAEQLSNFCKRMIEPASTK